MKIENKKILHTDILIIGGGTAGCYAALTIREKSDYSIIIAEKANIKRSGCLAAGVNAINAYIVKGRKPEDYVDYAKKDADGIVREDLLMTMSEGLNRVTDKMEKLGLVILKDENGEYVARGNRNIKINGENMKPILAEAVSKLTDCTVINRINITDYIVENNTIKGAYGFSIEDATAYEIRAKKVLCATGGAASICVSVNEEVVHGIPTDERILQEGDIVSLDAGVIYKGYHSDAARTVGVGEISEEARLLIERTRLSFFAGIKNAVAGNRLYDISGAIQQLAESFGYGVVYDLVGHGIGSHLHEDPEVPNFRPQGFRKGLRLKPGMTLAVEPMINAGSPHVVWMDDEWTVVTEDLSLSAHYENTILITKGKPEILSLTEDEKAAGFLELI